MRVVVRADSSSVIGTGHVTRCMTVAERLRERGSQVEFVCRELPGSINEMIESRGFVVHRLSGPKYCSHMREQYEITWPAPTQAADAEGALAVLGGHETGNVDWLIVDHYSLDRTWETLMRRRAQRIMVIDDLANRQHDCDLLLDQNLRADNGVRYKQLVTAQCTLLLGPRYALLRPEFRFWREQIGKHRERGPVRHLMVSFGGSDPDNVTAKAIEAIGALGCRDLQVDVVIGAANPHRSSIYASVEAEPNTSIYVNPGDIAELMARADIAIGGAGVTNWERCCIGLPSVVVAIAENQRPGAEALAEGGYVIYVGPSKEVTSREIGQAIAFLLERIEFLDFLRSRGMGLVDGKGVDRLIGNLEGIAIELRPATAADCDNVYLWRNDPEVRLRSFDRAEIPYETHRQWFYDTLTRTDRVLLVGERDGEAVGVLRFDFTDTVATVSIYLVPGMQGRGYGRALLARGSAWVRRERPEILMIRAEILATNEASIRAFCSAGFSLSSGVYQLNLKQ